MAREGMIGPQRTYTLLVLVSLTVILSEATTLRCARNSRLQPGSARVYDHPDFATYWGGAPPQEFQSCRKCQSSACLTPPASSARQASVSTFSGSTPTRSYSWPAGANTAVSST